MSRGDEKQLGSPLSIELMDDSGRLVEVEQAHDHEDQVGSDEDQVGSDGENQVGVDDGIILELEDDSGEDDLGDAAGEREIDESDDEEAAAEDNGVECTPDENDDVKDFGSPLSIELTDGIELHDGVELHDGSDEEQDKESRDGEDHEYGDGLKLDQEDDSDHIDVEDDLRDDGVGECTPDEIVAEDTGGGNQNQIQDVQKVKEEVRDIFAGDVTDSDNYNDELDGEKEENGSDAESVEVNESDRIVVDRHSNSIFQNKIVNIDGSDVSSMGEGSSDDESKIEPLDDAKVPVHSTDGGKISFEIEYREREEHWKERFYHGRLNMRQVSHLITTEQFRYEEQYPSKNPNESQDFSSVEMRKMIDQNLDSFTRDPSIGLSIYGNENLLRDFKKIDRVEYTPSLFSGGNKNLKPLKPFSEYTRQEMITTHDQLKDSLYLIKVRMIIIKNIDLSNENIPQLINKFRKTQVLVLENVGLGDEIRDIILSELRFCDVSRNKIEYPQSVIHLMEKSGMIESLCVEENPLCETVKWKEKILAATIGKHFRTLNGDKIEALEVFQAVQKVGSKKQRECALIERWDFVMNTICKKSNFQVWEPDRITSLHLQNAKLGRIMVGNFVNLKELNISHNLFRSLSHCGIEHASKLSDLNFSHNNFQKTATLMCLQFLEQLQRVWCHDNPWDVEEKPTLKIIYVTRFARGTNRCPGIHAVNDKKVLLKDRLEAIEEFGTLDERKRNFRFEYALIEKFGHYQLRCVDLFARKIKILELPSMDLERVDLTNFRGLEYLDLHSNRLREIDGLDRLGRLKFINLAKNSSLIQFLNTKIFPQLQKLSNLRHVIFKSSSTYSSTRYQKHRMNVLKNLFKPNPMLIAIDNVKISLNERLEALKSSQYSQRQLKMYAFHVSIMEQVVDSKKRSYLPTRVKPGVRYVPSDIVELRLSNLGLDEYGCNFESFINLEMLDLSYNNFTGFKYSGLERCKKIRILDLRHNNLDLDIKKDLAPFLDHFQELEIVALEGNKVLGSKKARLRLLKNLKIMQNLSNKLQIVDSQITAGERMQVWSELNITEKDPDSVERFEESMEQRGYLDCAVDEVTEINLNDSGLALLKLDLYVNLRILLLRNCRLKKLTNTGIFLMNQLRCVDLRNNQLTILDEIVSLINTNENLETLAISGNPFPNYQKEAIRPYILARISRLREPYCPLWEIDEVEISLDEIITAWSEFETTPEIQQKIAEFRFNTTIFRKYVTHIDSNISLSEIVIVRDQIIQLDLSNSRLSFLDFTGFKVLSKLSLQQNQIRDKDILHANLSECRIEELDIQSNKIKKLNTISKVIAMLPCLRIILFLHNDCYKADSPENRRKVLSRLIACKDPEWSLESMNGQPVTVDERIDAIKKEETRIELLRTKLHIHLKGFKTDDKSIDLNSCNLSNIFQLRTFKQLQRLTLRANNISYIPPEVIKSLPYLKFIDLSCNQMTMDAVLDSLCVSNSLRDVRLFGNCGVFQSSSPLEYTQGIFQAMRGLHMIDNVQNPYPLSQEQHRSASYLYEEFGIPVNSLLEVNLKVSQIEREHFWSIVLALRSLVVEIHQEDEEVLYVGPKVIDILEGNFQTSHVVDYRYILVSHIPSLCCIDGIEVTRTERTSVSEGLEYFTQLLKRVPAQSLKPVLNLNFVQEDLLSQGLFVIDQFDELSMKEGNKKDSTINNSELGILEKEKKQPKLSLYLSDKDATNGLTRPLMKTDITLKFIQENFDDFPLFQKFHHLVKYKSRNVRMMDGVVDRLENMIFFCQLFAIIYCFNIEWPQGFFEFFQAFAVSNLSFESILDRYGIEIPTGTNYLRFFSTMSFPLIFFMLFLFPTVKKQWDLLFGRLKILTFGVSIVIWVFSLFLGLGIGFAVDYSSAVSVFTFSGPPNPQFIWVASSFVLLFTFGFLFFIFIVVLFNQTRFNESFWNAFFVKFRMRASLFLISVTYMPVMRSIFVNFQCQEDSEGKFSNLLLFPDVDCPTSISNVPWIWYVAGSFGIFYGLAIPIFFSVLIYRDSKCVISHYNIIQGKKGIEKLSLSFPQRLMWKISLFLVPRRILKLLVKDPARMDILNSYNSLNQQYYEAVKDFDSGSSILYARFKRKFIYFKIPKLIQMVLLCACASLLYPWPDIQIPVGASFLVIEAFIVTVTLPHVDISQNIGEIMFSVLGALNLLIGYFFVSKGAISVFATNPTNIIVMYTLNGLFILVALLILLLYPVARGIIRWKLRKLDDFSEVLNRIQENFDSKRIKPDDHITNHDEEILRSDTLSELSQHDSEKDDQRDGLYQQKNSEETEILSVRSISVASEVSGNEPPQEFVAQQDTIKENSDHGETIPKVEDTMMEDVELEDVELEDVELEDVELEDVELEDIQNTNQSESDVQDEKEDLLKESSNHVRPQKETESEISLEVEDYEELDDDMKEGLILNMDTVLPTRKNIENIILTKRDSNSLDSPRLTRSKPPLL